MLLGVTALVVAVFQAPALVSLVGINPAEPAGLALVITTDLDGAVDVDLARLRGRVVVAVAYLDCSVDVDPAVLGSSVGALGLDRCRVQ